jgi:hypothetical protein
VLEVVLVVRVRGGFVVREIVPVFGMGQGLLSIAEELIELVLGCRHIERRRAVVGGGETVIYVRPAASVSRALV